jgi:hypothetical protein
MGFALVLRELSRKPWLLALGALLAAIAATFSVYTIKGGSLEARALTHSSASTQVIVDSHSSFLSSVTTGKSLESLDDRAMVYANLLATPALLNLIGKQAGIEGGQIYAAGPVDPVESIIVQEPTALKRNVQLTGETNPYRLNYTANLNLPTIGINAQAPTTPQAIALANGAVVAIQQYVTGLQHANRVPASEWITIHQLGPATGAVDDAGISKKLAAIVFVAVFLLWCVLILTGARFREQWRASATLDRTRGEWEDHWTEDTAPDATAQNGNGHRPEEVDVPVVRSPPEGVAPAHPVQSPR